MAARRHFRRVPADPGTSPTTASNPGRPRPSAHSTGSTPVNRAGRFALNHSSLILFIAINHRPLSYAYLTNKLHHFLSLIGIHLAPYSLHSLRAGAATTAAAAGCTEDQIQKLGRWSSTCYRRYIKPSKREQASMAPRLTTSLH